MGKAQLASNWWLILCQTKRVAHARNLAHLFSFLVWLLICETIWFRFLHFYNYNFYKRCALNSFWMQKRITIAKTGTTVPLNKSPLHFNWRGLWRLSQNDVKAKKGGNIAKESTSLLLNKFFSLETGSLLHFAPTTSLHSVNTFLMRF